jgi:hypothetical protein
LVKRLGLNRTNSFSGFKEMILFWERNPSDEKNQPYNVLLLIEVFNHTKTFPLTVIMVNQLGKIKVILIFKNILFIVVWTVSFPNFVKRFLEPWRIKKNISVTLVVEFQDQGFTSHKSIPLFQFGTNIYMIRLSLTFTRIK